MKFWIIFNVLSFFACGAHGAQFWDLQLAAEQDDNWNRAAQQSEAREDTVYQLGAKYGYSRELSPFSGLVYGVALEQHQWEHYKALDNTRLQADISYQKRLAAPLQAPWVSFNLAGAYKDYADRKRRGNQLELSVDVGQDFTRWQYQGRAAWKQNSAEASTFSTRASYVTLTTAYKATRALRFVVDLGFERGDVVSSVGRAYMPLKYLAQTQDDAFGNLNWQAYRLNADTLWQSLSVSYGWHGKHELSASFKAYDSDAEGLNYKGQKLGVSYTRLF